MQVMTNFQVGIAGAFCNLYENGKHHAPYHRDSYGTNVITLCFGETRIMENKDKNDVVTKYDLEDGDLVFFTQDWNSKNLHSIKKDSSKNARISIVFFCVPL